MTPLRSIFFGHFLLRLSGNKCSQVLSMENLALQHPILVMIFPCIFYFILLMCGCVGYYCLHMEPTHSSSRKWNNINRVGSFPTNERMPSYLSLGAPLQIRDKSVIFHVFTMSQQIYRFWTKGNCLSPNCEQKEASFSLKCSMLTESSSKTVKKTRQSAFAKKNSV